MSIPLSKVKPVTTAAEYSLVKQSRTPELNKLSLARVRQLTARARTAFDKWQDRTRQQSRSRAKSTGDSAAGERTQLKKQIFRDALDAYEARLKTLSEAAGKEKPVAARAKPSTRTMRTTAHRAQRASVRKQLGETLDEKQAKRVATRKKAAKSTENGAVKKVAAKTSSTTRVKSAAKKKPAAKTASAKTGAKRMTKPTAKTPSAATVARNTTTRTGQAASSLEADPQRQLKAKRIAKKNRIATSGLTTHTRGHVSARGKRKQASRDSD